MKNGINISILGEKEIQKLDLIKYYLKTNNITEISPKDYRVSFYINKKNLLKNNTIFFITITLHKFKNFFN